jgi:AbrB family looped-hinge helix DNA binding protein
MLATLTSKGQLTLPKQIRDRLNLDAGAILDFQIQADNTITARHVQLKEEFPLFWEHSSPAWAAKFLDAWCTRAMRSRIDPVKKFARTVRAHRELLLNYFKAKKQFSSGVVEGLNNKAKVTLRALAEITWTVGRWIGMRC